MSDQAHCRGCRVCTRSCAHGAISFGENRRASIDHGKCVGCGRCIGACAFDAINPPDFGANDELNCKIAEYAKAVVSGRPHFHISIANQISPFCDCHAENDAPIIPDVGMFASFDPVALDVACADACNAMPAMPGSLLGEHMQAGHAAAHHDHFSNTSPGTDWRVCTRHAEKIGLGCQRYELITL